MRTGRGVLSKAAAFAFFGILSLFMSFINSRSLEEYPNTFIRAGLMAIRERAGSFTVQSSVIGLLASAFLPAVCFSHRYDIRCKFNDHVLNSA